MGAGCGARWVEPGTYAVKDLPGKLGGHGGVTVRMDPEAKSPRVIAAARDVPLRHLLWAVEIATGLQARAVEGRSGTLVFLAARRVSGPESRADAILRLPASGYKPPSRTEFGRYLIGRAEGSRKQASEWWVGWRFADLPPLYTEPLVGDWSKGRYELSGPAGQTGSDAEARAALQDGWVAWVRFIEVAIALERADGGGCDYDLMLPVL